VACQRHVACAVRVGVDTHLAVTAVAPQQPIAQQRASLLRFSAALAVLFSGFGLALPLRHWPDRVDRAVPVVL
jgi:hypothetical protein